MEKEPLSLDDYVVQYGNSGRVTSGWMETFHYYSPKTGQVVEVNVGRGAFMDRGLTAKVVDFRMPAEGEGEEVAVWRLAGEIQAAFGVRIVVPRGLVLADGGEYVREFAISGGNYATAVQATEATCLVPGTCHVFRRWENPKGAEVDFDPAWVIRAIINETGKVRFLETTLPEDDVVALLEGKGFRRVYRQGDLFSQLRAARKAGMDLARYDLTGEWIAGRLAADSQYFEPAAEEY